MGRKTGIRTYFGIATAMGELWRERGVLSVAVLEVAGG